MRGETPFTDCLLSGNLNFNPLPSCEGRPDNSFLTLDRPLDFNPLPSCEGRHDKRKYRRHLLYFNPLPSCEGRRRVVHTAGRRCEFQSTPLMRGETRYGELLPCTAFISIHSPHARGDPKGRRQVWACANFNPLPSCEGRQALGWLRRRGEMISIHSPHARGDVFK